MIKKVLGILIIFVGIGLFLSLISNIPSIVSSFSKAIKTNLNYDWGSFTGELVINILLWIVDYFIIKVGLKLYRNS